MSKKDFYKELAKWSVENDGRPYKPGEKETLKQLIDKSETFEQFLLAVATAAMR